MSAGPLEWGQRLAVAASLTASDHQLYSLGEALYEIKGELEIRRELDLKKGERTQRVNDLKQLIKNARKLDAFFELDGLDRPSTLIFRLIAQ